MIARSLVAAALVAAAATATPPPAYACDLLDCSHISLEARCVGMGYCEPGAGCVVNVGYCSASGRCLVNVGYCDGTDLPVGV